MKITRTNPFTGEENTMDLAVTYEQVEAYFEGKLLVQDAFPQLTAGEREFIKTGITEASWDEMFGN
jgi:hypothetical protein